MRNVFVIILLFVINVSAQDFVFFNDSPSGSYYEQSFGFANAPSTLELANQNKFPVSTSFYFSGVNSLKLHWNSKTGGDWGLAVADQGWSGHNTRIQDSISFYVFSQTALQAIELPSVYIEDLNNTKTSKVNISDYYSGIPANVWTRIFIPLSIFEANSGSADLTKIKTIYFGQSALDEVEHTIYIDDVRMVKTTGVDTNPPSPPAGVVAKGYGKHIDVSWNLNTEADISVYYIYRLENSIYVRVGQSSSDVRFYRDWIGSPGISYSYKISAVDSSNNESGLSEVVSASTHEMSDDEYMDMVQEATFRYFWDYAHPVSGLARERLNSGNTVTTGGSGFGLMGLIAGIERGFVSREAGVERILKILNFLSNADRFHGAWPHWMNGTTGKVIPFSTYDDGGDLVETAFMIQGLLAVRQYFNQDNTEENQIRNLITSLWESVEWDWYKQFPSSNYLYWHWSPNYGWRMNFRLFGPNETMITYLLAIASPTHPISPNLYPLGWAGNTNYKNGKSFYGIPLYVGWDYGGPLFFAHYSFLGFDPRDKKDKYANYFVNNRNHTLINRAYSIANPEHHLGYNENTWGLTASDDPDGYLAHEPTASGDNGTISPTAALSSFPYTPEESMAVLKNLYNTYGEKLWGVYGFKDAFNLDRNWYANSYLAIDQGPIIAMIENYRSNLLWDNFMANPEIQPMLDAIGFVPDLTGTANEQKIPLKFELKNNYPNPFNPVTSIEYSIPGTSFVQLKIYDLLGKEIVSLVNEEKPAGSYKINFNADNLSSGVYFYTLKAGTNSATKKLLLMK